MHIAVVLNGSIVRLSKELRAAPRTQFSGSSLAESQQWHDILQPLVAASLTINRPGTISGGKGETITSPISPLTPDVANTNHSTAPAAEHPQQYSQDSLDRRFSVGSRASTAHSLSDNEGRSSYENGFRDGQKNVAFQEGPLVTAPHKG